MWRDYNDDQVDWDNWSYDENWDSSSTQSTQDEIIKVVDCNWTRLEGWDSVAAIKDLKVKWAKDIKRWDKFKNIRLTDDADLIESWKMVLRTEFFKKV